MAVTVTNSDPYNSGSGGFLATHTEAAFDCSGTDSCLIVAGYNDNPTSEVSGVTADGNAMTLIDTSENTNVVAVQAYRYLINDNSFDIVCSTPTFKLQAMISIALNSVDQTTPIAGTPAKTGGNGTDATASYTGTAGNLILAFVTSQNASTITPASGMTMIEDFDHGDTDIGQCWAGYITATGSSQTVGGTLSSTDNYRLLVVEVKTAIAAWVPKIVAF